MQTKSELGSCLLDLALKQFGDFYNHGGKGVATTRLQLQLSPVNSLFVIAP